MADSLVILVPILNRPTRIAPLVAAFQSVTTLPYRLLFLPDPTDSRTLAELVRLDQSFHIAAVARRFKVPTFPSKINAGFRATSEPLVMMIGDDVAPHPGWLEAAHECLAANPSWGVMATNDLNNPRVMAGRSATHPIIRRSYIERYGSGTLDGSGIVLHEGYRHTYCDTELVYVAKIRKAFGACLTSIVEHLHYQRELRTFDGVDAIARRARAADLALWQRRHSAHTADKSQTR